MNSMSCGSNSNSSNSSSNSSDSDHSDSRLTVADILSSMASGEVVTPTTFATLEGFSTGIPTRTTPTLTPTTLRNIEQTFIELQSVPAPNNHQHQHQAGFVPPVVNSITNTSTTSTITSTYQNIKEDSLWYSAPSPPTRVGTRKASGRMGGRRPNRQEKLSPEEEERRRVRRERNKLAAARCRKRRLDHTNSLIVETDELEERRQILQKEIGDLKSQKQQLQFVLDAHRCIYKNNNNNNSNTNGKLNGMSNSNHMKEIMDNNTTNSSMSPSPPPELMNNSSFRLESKHPTRPTSLHLPSNMSIHSTNLRLNTSVSVSDMTGVPISTPSNGMFNFDALMEGGTGLTPITSGLTPIIPTCSSQQRNCNTEMASPESLNPPKLVSL